MDPAERRHILDYDSAVAMRYHAHRRAFFEFANRANTAVSLLLGGTAFATLVGDRSDIAVYAAASVAAVNAFTLAFGTTELAAKHADLFRRWADLRADLVRVAVDDPNALTEIEVKRATIDGESPSQLEALTVLCENEEKELRRAGPRYRIGWIQRSLAPLLTLPGWRPIEE